MNIIYTIDWLPKIFFFVVLGRDTKLMMNSGKSKYKRTSLDRFLNILIMGVCFLVYFNAKSLKLILY